MLRMDTGFTVRWSSLGCVCRIDDFLVLPEIHVVLIVVYAGLSGFIRYFATINGLKQGHMWAYRWMLAVLT